MGPSGAPQSCPTIQIVRGCDFAIRSLQARLMKAGMDFKKSLEIACEDADTRCLHFTTIFGMEANSIGCRALTAPGLREIYGNLPSSAPAAVREKRIIDPNEPPATGQSPSAKKRARQRLNKAAKGTGNAQPPPAKAAAAPKTTNLAIKDKVSKGTKGGAKAAGKGTGKAPLPKGIKSKTADGKMICFAHNQGRKCDQEPCHFEHVCWWCLTEHAIGQPCP